MKAYVPAKGFERNPLKRHRNVACPCGSDKKAKRCHGRLDYLPEDLAEKARRYLRELSARGIIEAKPGEIAAE